MGILRKFANGLRNSAHEHTANANRKTIQPQDVLDALEELEFPEFTPRLKAELASMFLPHPWWGFGCLILSLVLSVYCFWSSWGKNYAGLRTRQVFAGWTLANENTK